ncbi:MAG TPA: asparagine synthase (glutamine-hydrolyzing) [Stellaceae bacterium]
MCGIAGILHWGRQPEAGRRVERMAAALHHRGPDDRQAWADADIALGFARLSIVDLAGGAQPMANEDGQVEVVYNGEIYNHRELRRLLEAAGHRFRSDHSDTEVVVHGWEEWGEDLPRRLNGMFAFAVWDRRRRCLFLGRDRFGIKPLYLCEPAPRQIVFGSEIRALVASGLVSRRADPAGVLEYLSLQDNWHGRTPFAGVEMLPPGHSERIDLSGRRRERYWRMSFPRRCRRPLAAAAAEYRDLLLEVVGRQIAADVPVMTYLSGGIDSSAITAAAHRLDNSVSAYSCLFDLAGVGDDRIVDEREFSRDVAQRLAIGHVELQLPQTALISALDATIGALEYPRMGMAYVNYSIAGRVAQDAKVVLSGLGGDEINGGYIGRYQIVPRAPVRRRPTWLGPLARLLDRSPPPDPGADPLELYRRVLNFPIPADELAGAQTPEFAAAADFDPLQTIAAAIDDCPSRDVWDIVAYIDATTYMHGLLVLEDKLSMAHGLETRVPLLDNALVDAALDLDWGLLCDGNTGKIVFREAVRPWVSPTIYAKPKMGFGPPDASWYRGALREWIEGRLSPRRIAARGILRPDYVKRRLDDHFTGRANNVAFIWSMLSLDSWCEQFGLFGGRLGETGAAAALNSAE